MHFHLPKPLHGWREFAGEVGIVVIGVLIALAAEQVVETVHWRHEVEAERNSLLQEAKDSYGGVDARRRQQGCVDRRLADIRLVLERHHRGEALGLMGPIGRPTGQGASRGTWQIALSGQALSHMDHSEKLAFSDAFNSFDLFDRVEQQEADSWFRMSSLNTPDLLGPSDWSNITAAYNTAVLHNDHIRALAPWLLGKRLQGVDRYRETGDLSGFKGMVEEICRPILSS